MASVRAPPRTSRRARDSSALRLLASLKRLDAALSRISGSGLTRPAQQLRIRIRRIAQRLNRGRGRAELPILLPRVERQVTELHRAVRAVAARRPPVARQLAALRAVNSTLAYCERALGMPRPRVTTGTTGPKKLRGGPPRRARFRRLEAAGRGPETSSPALPHPEARRKLLKSIERLRMLISSQRGRASGAARSLPRPKRAAKPRKHTTLSQQGARRKSPKRSTVHARKQIPRVAETPPRYANVALFDVETGRLDQAVSLQPQQTLRLQIDIGELSAVSQVTRAKPIPDKKLPRDIYLDVMVSSTDFLLESGNANVAHGRFFLPGDEGPAIAPDSGRFLNFLLRAPAQPGTAHCRMGYYFRNILVQSQQLSANVAQPGGFKITTDFTMSRDLHAVEDFPETRRISVLTNSNNDGLHQIVFRASDAKSEPPKGDTFTVKDSVLEDILLQFRAMLSERAPTTKQRSRSDLERDLRKLAPLGWQLYYQLPGQRPYVFDALFGSPGDFVVQVLRPTSSSFSVPWALMYEIPLLSEPYTLCPLVSQWQESAPLAVESMRTCPHGPHAENTLCPFGFWGFRYAIEQLAASDTPALQIRVPPSSDIVVAQTQVGVDLKALATHVQNLRDIAARLLPVAQLREGKDKTTIRRLLGQDLPFVYFYCHGKSASAKDPNTWLVVGKRETMTAAEFIGWIVAWSQKKIRVWNTVRPLVFVNACHSLAIYPTTLMSYVDAFVGSARAAGVIGTETRVNQTLAAKVAERFLELFLSGTHSVESALRAIRFEYLAAGNLLGLVYTPYCWGDLKIVAA